MNKKAKDADGPATKIEPIRKSYPYGAVLRLTQVDPPAKPTRETMDEVLLEELIESMRNVGLLCPIAVRENGARYEVLAGHRRYVAACALAWDYIDARVYAADCRGPHAIRAHENAMREQVNPAEESKWLWDVLENVYGGDVLKLCDGLHLKQQYAEERLNLARGDQEVFKALGQSTVSIGVAQELNQVKDTLRRRMYLQAAVEGGATAKVVRQWRQQGNALDALQPLPPVIESGAVTPPTLVNPIKIECFFCGDGPNEGYLLTLLVHKACLNHFTRLAEGMTGVERAAASGVRTDGN